MILLMRGAKPVRILAWVITGAILGLVLCCGGLFLAGTVSPSLYR
ncbi:hypothetical protein GA0070613_4282 [Micromonospora inositola]|uniref:Uncharacterized protein n=1 Tax=Micromonospora inositola TaxID=47865 RepID=A0A1C5J9T9_9ACTN|nr:hypothetical protein GA0070613_4282 [Micromonospora inositola]